MYCGLKKALPSAILDLARNERLAASSGVRTRRREGEVSCIGVPTRTREGEIGCIRDTSEMMACIYVPTLLLLLLDHYYY